MRTPQEDQDATRVDEAVKAIRKDRIAVARQLLEAVIANTPTPYVCQYQDGDALVIKFWDTMEFMHYAARHKELGDARVINWQPSAYPRARYYLAFLAVKEGDFEGALVHLDEGEKLEPHPLFALERAQALLRGRQDTQGALASYQRVLDRGDEVPDALRAVALRGKGFISIERGELDEAERYFHESQKLDPDSPVARNELRYIASLRGGGQKAPAEVVATGMEQGRLACSACGAEVKEGQLVKHEGRVIYLCQRCQDRLADDEV